ncbi:MAG: electron transport complex subunit RsxC [Christensenellales bacterium]
MKTFRRGVHPKGNKSTSAFPIEIMDAPEIVTIPLSQHAGKEARAVVSPGDKVKAGTLIGAAQAGFSANVHSSVSGEVIGIIKAENTLGRKSAHISIKNDFSYEEERLAPLDNPTPEAIVQRIFDAGIVGLGGATFPTAIKFQKKVRTLIINGAECEPYITCDHRLMLEYPEKIMQGIAYAKLASGAEEVLIGVEANKPDAISALERAASEDVQVVPLKTKYPQGGEKQLIYALTRKRVPEGGLPSDVGCLVVSIATGYAIYEACALGKPLYGRFMTVSGGGVVNPKNIYARTGVPFSYLADKLGSNDEWVKAIVGGPMMGIALDSLEPCCTKGVNALLLLTPGEISCLSYSECINCAKCANVCPMRLMPMFIDANVQHERFAEAKRYGALACIECGCCAYICPAKRPLVQSIRVAKKIIREKKI